MQQDTCAFHDGPLSECADDERDWFPQLSVCHPTMQLQYARRRWDKLHEEKPYHDGTFTIWYDKQTRSTPFHYKDGTTIWLAESDLGLGGDFLQQGSVAPEVPADRPQ